LLTAWTSNAGGAGRAEGGVAAARHGLGMVGD